MTLILASLIAAVLLGLALMQTCFTWRFYRFVMPAAASTSEAVTLGNRAEDAQSFSTRTADFQPEVAVVLCLRGDDPSLMGCLTGISTQDYPNYQLHLVVDDILDPALKIVEDFYQSLPTRPPVHVITELTGKCSLKCAALLEAIRSDKLFG